MARTLGIVLAGGRGVRLGRVESKALVLIEGRTLLDRAIETLASLSDERVVSLSPRRPIPSDRFRGASVVWDAPGAEGPLAGIVAALSSRVFERAIVLGVDYPLVRAGALLTLIERLGSHPAVVPVPDGRMQPLCAAYAACAVEALARSLAGGERSLVRAVAELGPLRLEDAELKMLPGGLENFLNVNTSEDLEAAALKLRGRRAESAV